MSITRISAKWLGSKIKIGNRHDIFNQIALLIKTGKIPVGTFLPNITELANILNMSVGNVSWVWAQLSEENFVNYIPKTGVVVTSRFNSRIPKRIDDFNPTSENNAILINARYTKADPQLLPNLKPALLAAIDKVNDLNDYTQFSIAETLLEAVKKQWPYTADNYLVLNDNYEAIKLILLSFAKCTIAVETPLPITLLDLVNKLNVKLVPVECDNFGPIPDRLAVAMKQNPVVFIYQPRTQIPTGYTVNKKRLKELAKVLRWQNNVLIIENDLTGDISQHISVSLGSYYPDQTVYIRSYFRTYGQEVGRTVISGPESLLLSLKNQLNYVCNNGSILLQTTLAWLISDKSTQLQIKKARREYGKRINKVVDALQKRGVEVTNYDGFCLWLPVAHEKNAIIVLARQGILVVGGEHLMINKKEHQAGYIRVSTNTLQEWQIGILANALSNVII